MSTSSIARQNLINQVPTEGNSYMSEVMVRRFVKELIRENAKYENGDYVLFVCDLSRSDQRLFLANVVDADEYEWACENPSRLEAFIAEKSKYMQKLIDENIDEVYHENLYEAKYHRFD